MVNKELVLHWLDLTLCASQIPHLCSYLFPFCYDLLVDQCISQNRALNCQKLQSSRMLNVFRKQCISTSFKRSERLDPKTTIQWNNPTFPIQTARLFCNCQLKNDWVLIFASYLGQIKVHFWQLLYILKWYNGTKVLSQEISNSYTRNIRLTDDTHPCQVFNLVLYSDLSISLLISSKLHVPQMQNTSYNAQQILGEKQQADIKIMSYKETQNDDRKDSEMYAAAITVCKHSLYIVSGFLQRIHSLWKLPLDRNRAEKVLGEGILAELISESYLHLVVIEAYDGQGSSHNLPVVFIIYGTDPCTVTLKIHSLTL